MIPMQYALKKLWLQEFLKMTPEFVFFEKKKIAIQQFYTRTS
jgi:hypothetical protein